MLQLVLCTSVIVVAYAKLCKKWCHQNRRSAEWIKKKVKLNSLTLGEL